MPAPWLGACRPPRPTLAGSTPSSLGISSASERLVEAVAHEAAPDLVLEAESCQRLVPWMDAPPSRKTLWKRRRESGKPEVALRPPSLSRREISPDMRDKCFRCLEKGHFRRDCTNDVVFIRCGMPGHEVGGCTRPRSPSLEDELQREVAAKVTRRSESTGGREAAGVRPMAALCSVIRLQRIYFSKYICPCFGL